MKRLLYCLSLIILFSCTKGFDPDPISPDPGNGPGNQQPGPPRGGGGGGTVIVSACTYPEVTPPTSYTYTNVANMPAGFGIFSDVNYDKGWRQGYQDALFYMNYYEIMDGTTNTACGSLTTKKKILDGLGHYRYESMMYNPVAGEIVVGLSLVWGDCRPNWMLKQCVLWNSLESKYLRLQYEFNNNYTGPRTPDEIQFDRGRYEGFVRGITTEPLTP